MQRSLNFCHFVDVNKMVTDCHHLKMPPALQIPEAQALE